MKRVIIAGSPRANGRSGKLAEMLFEASIDERPEDELFLVPVAEVDIAPCIACDGCRKTMPVTIKGDDGEEVTLQKHRCVFDDDMQMVYDLLDDADEVVVVAPVFFSGATASLKALLDRLQPYFWANTRANEKRPLTLHVVGEGGDPYGYGPLVSEVRSAFACAGFAAERVLDWVGKIDADGEITAEAEEVPIPPLPGVKARAAAGEQGTSGAQSGAGEVQGASAAWDAAEVQDGAQDEALDAKALREAAETRAASKRERPKLDLSASSRKTARKSQQPAQSRDKQGGAQRKSAGAGKRADVSRKPAGKGEQPKNGGKRRG